MISIIVIISENRVIANKGDIPWKIPEDLKRFRKITMGHPVIMGRKTFETLPKEFAGRTNIVITRDGNYQAENAVVINSLEEAIEKAKKAPGSEEIFIIGGGQIFQQAISMADKLYLTIVEGNWEGDTFFPDYPDFIKISYKEKKESGKIKYTFLNLQRK